MEIMGTGMKQFFKTQVLYLNGWEPYLYHRELYPNPWASYLYHREQYLNAKKGAGAVKGANVVEALPYIWLAFAHLPYLPPPHKDDYFLL